MRQERELTACMIVCRHSANDRRHRFHTKCIGITQKAAKKLDEYICDACTSKAADADKGKYTGPIMASFQGVRHFVHALMRSRYSCNQDESVLSLWRDVDEVDLERLSFRLEKCCNDLILIQPR